MSGLHGVETIELTTGTVAVQTISTAVIGLVGTAPDASGGVCASGTAGSWLLGTALDFTAKQEGRVGNKISVVAVAATEQNAQTVASLKGTTLTITLGTDEHSQVNATADRVTEVVNALGDSPVTAAVSTLNAGSAENNVVSPFSLTLSGG
ncbi:phage tail protein, partial [Escherichia coli]|nr:phage tail protein [Escherichia coli]MCQ5816176.1 phage tail protein [Escherichia coli]MCQ5859367.1 phage tail protein [Escherichia coli]MCQ5893924.1 phage tail protein [Escherichia coli]MCQ5899126.1 phage tail protein [Escherichia coli]